MEWLAHATTHARTHARTCTSTHTQRIHIYIHKHTHTHTHTHEQKKEQKYIKEKEQKSIHLPPSLCSRSKRVPSPPFLFAFLEGDSLPGQHRAFVDEKGRLHVHSTCFAPVAASEMMCVRVGIGLGWGEGTAGTDGSHKHTRTHTHTHTHTRRTHIISDPHTVAQILL